MDLSSGLATQTSSRPERRGGDAEVESENEERNRGVGGREKGPLYK